MTQSGDSTMSYASTHERRRWFEWQRRRPDPPWARSGSTHGHPAKWAYACEVMKWGAIAIVGVSVIVAAPKLRAAEGDGSSPGPLGAVHVEAAARVMGGPEIAPQQFSAAGPLNGGMDARAGASYRGFYGRLSSTYFPANGNSSVDIFPPSS